MMHSFTVQNWKLKLTKHPIEDSYRIRNNTIGVSDGVTRDPILILPDRKNPIGMLRFLLNYPGPSPAKIAANIFTETFCSCLKDYNPDNRDEKAIIKSFEQANKNIGAWNKENILNLDFLMNDFAGCVAAGTSQKKAAFSFGYLADCGIAVFNSNGDLKFRTKNEGPNSKGSIDEDIGKKYNTSFKFPEGRKIIRSLYRNNPEEPLSYGVLTGEDSAMHYVKTGTQEIEHGEHLIVYTDGLESVIFSSEFSDLLRRGNIKGIKKLCKKKVKTEGTLVYGLQNYSHIR